MSSKLSRCDSSDWTICDRIKDNSDELVLRHELNIDGGSLSARKELS